jgi:hypothetical protein
LLRWLEDGPLVVVSDGSGAGPKLKARLIATGQEGTFGESGERFTAAVEDTPANSRELLARVDFAPDSDAGMESMLGFRQDLGFAGSVESVAAVAIHPEEVNPGSDGEGLDEAAVRSWEALELGDEFEAEVGSTQVMARFSGGSPNTVVAALPSALLGWRDGSSTVSYRMATSMPGQGEADETSAATWLPRVSVGDGELRMEHGLHQELGWKRHTDVSTMTVLVYGDRVDNPVVEAMSHTAAGAPVAAGILFDPASGLMRAAGDDFSNAGVVAAYGRRLPGGDQVRVSYSSGDALALPAAGPSSRELAQAISAARPRYTQSYSISLSGTLEGTRTPWRASYRWQSESTITRVAPFAEDADEPYLSFHFRQPIHLGGTGRSGFEALLDIRNLLAQGYRPYLLNDGSLLVFAQDQRSVGAGLAFTF